MRSSLTFSILVCLGAGCAHQAATPAAAPPISAEAIVASPDRTDADRQMDPGRKPVAFLEFLKVSPGMKVAELFAGGGYTTELLVRAVGPTGVVYGQNTKMALERFLNKWWSERLARPINKNVVSVVREMDDPLPPEAKELDLVVSNIVYHDSLWMGADRAKMNAAVFAALKSGGRFVVCDSSAKPGTGVEAAQTLHRIDEEVVKKEVPAAGFQPDGEGNFLRNPADPRDWNSAPNAAGDRRGTEDRFCLAFKKP